jgi:hypothetical protein
MGEMRNTEFFAQKIGSRYTCEDNLKMDLKETGWEGVDYIQLFMRDSKTLKEQ